MQAEVAQVRRHEMRQNRLPALLAKERLVTNEQVSGAQLALLYIGDEPLGWRKCAHLQYASRMLLTSVRATSRDRRSRAGVSSSKKLESSRETWYCSRNVQLGLSNSKAPFRSTSDTRIVTVTSAVDARPVCES